MTRRVVPASLLLKHSDEGGRATPMISGYRSLARLDDERDYRFELDLDSGSLSPGERGPGQLSFWAVSELPELTEGQEFEVREGPKVVGWGTVLAPRAGPGVGNRQ